MGLTFSAEHYAYCNMRILPANNPNRHAKKWAEAESTPEEIAEMMKKHPLPDDLKRKLGYGE